MPLNPLVMNTHDLLRYSKPASNLEKALFEKLQEYFNIGDLQIFEDMEQEISELEERLDSSEEFVEELQFKISELEEEILVLWERD